jgi:hypothetical protein
MYYCPICDSMLDGNTPCPAHKVKAKFAGHFRGRKLDKEMKARIKEVLALIDKVSQEFGGIVEWVVNRIGSNAGAIEITTAFGTIFEYLPWYDAVMVYIPNYTSAYNYATRVLRMGAAELRLALYIEMKPQSSGITAPGTYYGGVYRLAMAP